ncbi:MAG: hypothetical protein E6Q40_07150 [Cupriavidus sp.]|nr:MAG: hypothetical protein E6Q40_07150 [Cupriavidus sp.]
MVNIVDDGRSRSLVKSFLEVVRSSYIGDYGSLVGERRLPPKSEFFTCGGACFAKSMELDEAIDLICARCHDRAEASHDDDVIECLWSAVADVLPQGGAGSLVGHVKTVLEKLERVVRGERLYINDNHVIHLHAGPISIGPVRAISSSSLTEILAERHPDAFWLLTGGSSKARDAVLRPNMSPVCWEVRLRAAPRQVEVRAEQLIGLALSILRLSLEEIPPLYPDVGDIETSNASKQKLSDTSIVITGDSVLSRGSAPLGYWVDYKVAGLTYTKEFRERADVLFDPPSKSVASRVSQGLVWQTRARQSLDRAERLLFFFTSIEALLTKGSSDPVTETIARFSSIMLENNPVARERIYKRVKKLYGVRSTVTHSGSHAVTNEQAESIHNLAEALYRRVFNTRTLVQGQDEFIAELEAATHGAAWPPAPRDTAH